MYSNLTLKKKGIKEGFTLYDISGESDGVTLIGSPYLYEKSIDDVRVIWSKLDVENIPEGENIDKYKEFFSQLKKETGFSMREKTFIVSPDYNYVNSCYGDNEIVSTYRDLEGTISYYRDGKLYDEIENVEIDWNSLE